MRADIKSEILHPLRWFRMTKQMNRFSKIILIAIIAVAGAGFLSVQDVKAVAAVEIEFQNEPLPLFHDLDTKPCDVTSRWIKVTNNSGQIQPISIQATNFPNPILPEDLSRALSIVIKQGTTDLYGGSTGSKTLYDFYRVGEIDLSDVGIGVPPVQYDITISFPCDKDNYWQEKTTNFDIVIHFSGGEEQNGQDGDINATIVSGGGGGGNGPITFGPRTGGDTTQEDTGQGGGAGQVLGESIFLPATGFDFNEFVILAMILLALIGLRVILKRKSAAIS